MHRNNEASGGSRNQGNHEEKEKEEDRPDSIPVEVWIGLRKKKLDIL